RRPAGHARSRCACRGRRARSRDRPRCAPPCRRRRSPASSRILWLQTVRAALAPLWAKAQVAYTLAICVDLRKMLVANLRERLSLVHDGRAVDVASASEGRFASDPQAVYEDWDAFVDWASGAGDGHGEPYDPEALAAPVPRPR